MTFPLRVLEARFQKVVTATSDEKGADGKYIFRDEDGNAFMWGPGPHRYEFHNVDTPAEADLIQFLCPACFAKNGGAKGTHRVLVSLANRSFPEEAGSRDSNGKPSRWAIQSGTGLDDLVLTPSILLGAGQPPDKGCRWHGFVGSSGIPPGHAG